MLFSCGFYDDDGTIRVEVFIILEKASTELSFQKYRRIGIGHSTISGVQVTNIVLI